MMNYFPHLFTTSLLAASVTMAMAEGDSVPTAYGWLDSEPWAAQCGETERTGLASFALSDPSEVHVSLPLSFDNRIATAAYHDGYWYYIDYVPTDYGYDAGSLSRLDAETGDVEMIADYGAEPFGPVAAYMAWSYVDQKMYALNGLNCGNGLVSVNLETGELTTECYFIFDDYEPNDGEWANQLNSFACTYDGEMYGVSYWGKLYKINPSTGNCHLIAPLSYLGELTDFSGSSIQYPNNCLFFDEDRDQWYLHMFTYPYPSAGYSMLLKLDITTGETEPVLPNNVLGSCFHGLYVPFQVAGDSAPAKVTDFTLTPGSLGALQATLDWYNPAVTYGQGTPLIALDSVVVYRDGSVLKTYTDVAPGQHLTLVDEVPESRFYSYSIQAFNEAGAGDRKALSAFVGHDTPVVVGQLTATADDTPEHKILVSWTAPTTGIYQGWIDAAHMTYRVVRSDGQMLYEALAETSFVDAPASLASYTYTVTAVTPDGESKPLTTEACIGGPAILLPHTFTFSEDEFQLWTVYDNNGDESQWQPANMYSYNALYPGAYVSYSYYYDQPGADWLISPAIRFEAGKRYKLTFDARSNGVAPELLAITLGPSADWYAHDSIDQFEFSATQEEGVELRTNLPVAVETGERYLGFYARSYYQNWQVSIANARIEEDHDGSLTGVIQDVSTGAVVPLATVTLTGADGKQQETLTDPQTGAFTFRYVASGEATLTAVRLGYEDVTATALITEYETTSLDLTMQALATYTLTATVCDKVGQPVADAEVSLMGYNEYAARTAADGTFRIADIMASDDYTLVITSNRLQAYQAVQPMIADTDLGTIMLDDKILPPARIEATLNEAGVPVVTWSNPVNDDVTLRYDANLYFNSMGAPDYSGYAVFGNIFRTPGLYRGAQFYLGESNETIYGVTVMAFDLDDNGRPTSDVLGSAYCSVTQGAWTTMDFYAPIEAPRGCYICVQYYGFVGLGVSEASESYPFVPGVSCYTGDYTTGQFFNLEDAGYPYNFMLRATVAPYDIDDAPAAVAAFRPTATVVRPKAPRPVDVPHLATMPLCRPVQVAEPSVSLSSIGDRTWFDLYRLTPATTYDPSAWTQLLDSVKQRSYVDEGIAQMPMGTYGYAVRCHYTDGLVSDVVYSDTIGWQMYTTVTFRLTTNTPQNDPEGAFVQIISGGGRHVYNGTVNAQGEVIFEHVWKADYDLSISLKDFDNLCDHIVCDKDDAYTFEYQLHETQVTPFNLKVVNDDATEMGNRLLVWNISDQIFEDFEDHEAFALNSPGELGWQYLDFDDPSEGTGFMNDLIYPNRGGSFAYMVFNLGQAEGGQNYSYYLDAYSGQQMLTSWANSTDQNWLVSPRLFYDSDFKFAFQAKGLEYQTESFMVGYTTSLDWTDTSSYQWFQYEPEYVWEVASEVFMANSYWTRYTFDVPAEANYVTIRQTGGNYIFMIDDICLGLPDGFPSYKPAAGSKGHFQAPSLQGSYQVYLDGQLVGQTDDKQYYLSELSAGEHTAGVVATYASGNTEMTTITFTIDSTDGIEELRVKGQTAPAYDLSGRHIDATRATSVYVEGGKKKM